MHVGHLQLAQDAIDRLGLDELRCIPAGQPPHRDVPQTEAAHRLVMARLAFTGEPGCVVDDAEVLQAGPSWTIRTLERLRKANPQDSLVLILGADALLGLPSWHCWQALTEYAHIAVANRPGTSLLSEEMSEPLRPFWLAHYTEDVSQLHELRAGCLVSFTIAPCKVSATEIRHNLKLGLPIGHLVPPAVEKYIVEHHLYL